MLIKKLIMISNDRVSLIMKLIIFFIDGVMLI